MNDDYKKISRERIRRKSIHKQQQVDTIKSPCHLKENKAGRTNFKKMLHHIDLNTADDFDDQYDEDSYS